MFEIRNATMNDFKRLCELENIAFPPEKAASDKSIKERIELTNDTFFVACIEDKIIGFINGIVIDQEYISDDLFEEVFENRKEGGIQSVLSLGVEPEYQRQGIAAALLKELEKEAKSKKRTTITLTCLENLIHYYERQGYKNMGLAQSQHGGATWYNMNMDL